MTDFQGKKVAIIAAQLAAGGAERFVAELSSHAARRGVETHLILLFKKPHFYSINSSVIIHEPDFLLENTTKPLYFFKLFRFLRATTARIRPDAMLCFGYISLVIFCLLNRRAPLFISNRSNPLKPRPLWYRVIRRLMYSRANGMIAQTQLAADVFERAAGVTNIAVIPNFVREMPDFELIPKENLVVSVGRFIKSKNMGGLLNAFARLDAPGWRLALVGDGPQRSALQQAAQTLGCADRVIFTGFEKNVDAWLSKAQIFAFASLSEGYPNALVEGMAAPLACVSYDCPAGPADIIRSGENGFLIRLGDERAFADALQQLIDQPDLRKKLAANARLLRRNLHVDVIGDRYLSFILNDKKTA